MELIVYQKQYKYTFDDFVNRIYHMEMKHLASDLLAKGVHPEDIKMAVKKAIVASENSGLDAKKHFQPVISVKNGTSFIDCRLSELGYSLVLLNIEPKSKYIAAFQVKVANKLFIK